MRRYLPPRRSVEFSRDLHIVAPVGLAGEGQYCRSEKVRLTRWGGHMGKRRICDQFHSIQTDVRLMLFVLIQTYTVTIYRFHR